MTITRAGWPPLLLWCHYRENTVHDIQQGLNKGHIVTEVDPDAPLRQNKNLSELDEVCNHSVSFAHCYNDYL